VTRGTISLKVVHDRLGAVESGLRDLRALPVDSLETFVEDFRNPPAAESLLRRAIEALLDTARHLLPKSFGEGTLEYKKVAVRHGRRSDVS
jgi:predicted signal transduction protein with EAL and GGDEF domain